MTFTILSMMARNNSDVDKAYLPYFKTISGVVAAYRVGSRFDGTARRDSDMDYMLLIDSNRPYGPCWVSGMHDLRFDMWIELIMFTKGDLQNPDFLEDSVRKVAFVYEKYRGRELLLGSDVFEFWLSPEMSTLFEKLNLSRETARDILHQPIPEP